MVLYAVTLRSIRVINTIVLRKCHMFRKRIYKPIKSIIGIKPVEKKTC